MYPLFKWMGGKRVLAPQIVSMLPDGNDGTYFEPFLGGGAVLLHYAPKRAVISDTNAELINVWQWAKRDATSLANRLHTELSTPAFSERYYDTRADFNDNMDTGTLEQAVRFIWLNLNCFNALYRTNHKGRVNMAWGKKTSLIGYDYDNMVRVGEYLKHNDVRIERASYEHMIEQAKAGDAVYFDPPYIPASATANFVEYTKDGFSLDDQLALARRFDELASRGVRVVESNSDTVFSRELYGHHELYSIDVRRTAGVKASTRGTAKELIIVGKQQSSFSLFHN